MESITSMGKIPMNSLFVEISFTIDNFSFRNPCAHTITFQHFKLKGLGNRVGCGTVFANNYSTVNINYKKVLQNNFFKIYIVKSYSGLYAVELSYISINSIP